MPDTQTVKQALTRLAHRTTDAPSADGGWFADASEYRSVVDEADAAVESVEAAVAFLDADRLASLEEAIETAEAAGDHAAARRGRNASEALAAFREAARGDQFHRARGTTLGGGVQGVEHDAGDTYG
ncbi:hypothetical protein [Halorientalis halophila]|uniref:hypothetical protein n=1 Tax=Halorientalis halophila TaxID=3108499 RepID=UPI00300A2815